MVLFVLVVALVASGILYVTKRHYLDFNDLRQFPAPSFVASASPLWGMWYSWNGTQYKAVYQAHQRLGPVVRLGPSHVSFTDPAAYRDIYDHRTSLVKDGFYARIAGGSPSMAQTIDKSIHSDRRRKMAHVVSAKEITAMEPRVMKAVGQLCLAIKVKAAGDRIGPDDMYETTDGAFDIRPWLNMLTYDAITSMFFSNSYGFLQAGNDLCLAVDEAGHRKQVHAMDTFHSASRFNTTVAQLPRPLYKLSRKILFWVHGNSSGRDFVGMARAQVMYRLAHQPAERDLFSCLPTSPTAKGPMPIHEVIAKCTTMLDAGSDTTHTALTNCIYHLAASPDKQRKLYMDLAAVVTEEYASTRILPSRVLQKVPYLRAVLDENWRCRPPLARGPPRVTTGQCATIAGHYIPAGVTVSAPIYPLHHNERLFRQAHEFIPERWIPQEEFGQDEQEARNLKEYCIPFSIGPRACIGRNLAYMEVSIVIAALVLNFEWELAEPGTVMEMVERFNYNPKELMVRVKAR